MLILPYSDEKESTKTVKRGSGGKISERELYQVQLDDEDNELEAALARSRRYVTISADKNYLISCLVLILVGTPSYRHWTVLCS